MTGRKDVEQLLKRVRAAGCATTPTRNGHIKVLTPGGGIVVVPTSPSDWRTLANIRRDLKRAGVEV